MIQNIIVAVIILAALAYTAWSVYGSVRRGEKAKSACGGCTGCDLKNRINNCEQTTRPGGYGVENKLFKKDSI